VRNRLLIFSFAYMIEKDISQSKEIQRIISDALSEDIGDGDHTSLAIIPEHIMGSMVCKIKEAGRLAGVTFAGEVFKTLDTDVQWELLIPDGSEVNPGDIAFKVRGKVRALLSAERLALNVMQRMSGIATFTAAAVEQLKGTSCKVLDTRKTTPVVRILEKWAVRIGGGHNHRFGLFDMILIKDNHIDFAGGIIPALQSVHAYQEMRGIFLPIEIEARTIEDVLEILAFGKVDRILLDNMEPEMMKECVHLIGGKYETEASGNITLENIRAKAESGVNYISLGALTHSYKSLDISLKADFSRPV
jgi:nicotinate-nucleotide pyrophosphorylase (carboxylating)